MGGLARAFALTRSRRDSSSRNDRRLRPGYIESLKPRVLLGRGGDPAELAAPLVWLASDGGSFVTGQTIVVDGGVTIT